MIRRTFILFAIAASVIALSQFITTLSHSPNTRLSYDPDSNRRKATLLAFNDFNFIDYYIYKGVPVRFNKVSRYDDLIRKFSLRINWDWRLLASLICQESEFRPDVISSAGAYGLMQIMPLTGKSLGIDIKASPEDNIRAGILYIRWLNSIFEAKVPDTRERLNFVLASYNAGPGHVLDAMRLAGKNGKDPGKWDGNVAVWLLKKSEPQYYNDSDVKNGYFRGRESVKFVSEIIDRFERYRNIIPEVKSRPF